MFWYVVFVLSFVVKNTVQFLHHWRALNGTPVRAVLGCCSEWNGCLDALNCPGWGVSAANSHSRATLPCSRGMAA